MPSLTWTLAILGLAASSAHAAGEHYQAEIRIYQVLSSVVDTGTTASTLPGMDGWLQVIHQRIDSDTLLMENETLHWNGQPEPASQRIIKIGSPEVELPLSEITELSIGSDAPVQYMEPGKDGALQVRTYTPESKNDEIGMGLSLVPKRIEGDAEKLSIDLDFRHVWIRSREPIAGTNLDVGLPVLGRAGAKGEVQVQLGKWSCLRVPLEEEGWTYLFLRVLPKTEDASPQPVEQKTSKPLYSVAESSETGSGEEAESSGRSFLKNVEIGGSIRIRVERRFTR